MRETKTIANYLQKSILRKGVLGTCAMPWEIFYFIKCKMLLLLIKEIITVYIDNIELKEKDEYIKSFYFFLCNI